MARKIAKETLAATLTIHGASKMSKDRRTKLADWLREKADGLLNDGDRYSARFSAKRFFIDWESVAGGKK